VTAAEPGDVVMLEMQTGDPNDPNDTDWGPAELEATVWLIVNSATDTEIIVVAAAGNGDQDLDSAEYDYYMGRGDSGAIIVGAGTADTSHDRLPFSTYGSRLNLQGWGESVVTLGYGDLAIIGDDENQMYTDTFSGTSSATPMVTSAVVAVQGLAVEAIGRRLDPWEMRELLVLTGIPQGSGGHIGPIPDVLAAGQAVDTIPGTWVDFEYSGPEVGTFLYPYNSLLEGVTAVTPGGTLAFKPGSTLEPTTISRAMTLRAVGGAVTIGS